jgi:hypothetical protein
VLPSAKQAGFLSSITGPVIIVAVLAALFHIAPHWAAQLQTPPGAKFTGNLSISPDVMQYRVWARRTQTTGPLVDTTFTNVPNEPHLLVLHYYVAGKIANWIGTDPEYVFHYIGALLAFAFTILLFATVRHFTESRYQSWWCFTVILIGGGLGAHLLLLENFGIVKKTFILDRVIIESIQSGPGMILEEYWGHYALSTLTDDHFLMIWFAMFAAVISFYFTVSKFSLVRVLLTAALYAVLTLLHLYAGVTLTMITLSITFLCWRKKLETRPALVTSAVCIASVIGCMCWHFYMFRSSGISIPRWRAPNILISTLLLGFPLAWLMIFTGLSDFYRRAGLKECFLLGWALGCVILALSGPFYPYPDRGIYTLQIPLYLIAGNIFFSRYKRVDKVAIIVMFLFLGATPAWMLKNHWVQYNGYDPHKPHVWMSAGHCEIVDVLKDRAAEEDVLMVDKTPLDWAADDLWLAPYHPGKLYCGHFFLTPQYEEIRAGVIDFFRSSDPNEQAAFLDRERIRFIYVNAQEYPEYFDKRIHEPERLERIPGVSLIEATSVGYLFEYSAGSPNVQQ